MISLVLLNGCGIGGIGLVDVAASGGAVEVESDRTRGA